MRAPAILLVALTAGAVLVAPRAASAAGELPLVEAAKKADAATLKALIARRVAVDATEGRVHAVTEPV